MTDEEKQIRDLLPSNEYKIEVVSDNHWIQITTPWLDIHNDMIQIYVQALESNRFCLISEDFAASFAIGDLVEARKIVARFGVDINEENLLCVYAEEYNFCTKLRMITEAAIVLEVVWEIEK